MKRRADRYLKSTFVRYTVSYALLFALLLACIIAFMYTYARKTLYDNTVSSEISKLESVRYQSEGYLATMTSITEQLSLSAAVKPFVFSESPAKAYSLIKLLKPYAVTNAFCDQIYLQFSIDDHLYSSSTSVSLDMFVNSVMTYERVTSEQLEDFLRTGGVMRVLPGQAVANALTGGSAARMVTFVMPLGIMRSNTQGNVIFMIPESEFSLLPADGGAGLRNRYILYNGEIIVAGESFDINQSNVYSYTSVNHMVQTHVKRVSGREYLMITVPGNNKQFSYITVIPLTDIYGAAAGGWMRIVAILLAFAAPCLILATLISRGNYRPIRDMRRLFPAGAGEDAGEDDIRAIRMGIDNLFLTNRDLDLRHKLSLPARRALCVRHLINGQFATREEAVAAAEDAGIDASKPYYAVILISAPDSAQSGACLEKTIAEAPKGVCCAGTELPELKQTLVIAFADEARALDKCASKLREAYDDKPERIAVAMSDKHGALSDMPKAYIEAASAYEHRFSAGDARVLRYGDISSRAQGAAPQARGYTDAIKQALASGDANLLSARIDDLMMFIKHTDMSLFAFRLIYNDVIGAILSRADISAQLGADALKLRELFTLSGLSTIDDMEDMLKKLCARILRGALEDEQQPLIKNILAYMADNYADREFSLAAAAEKFGLSTTRLSLAFKETMRMTPSDYLTMLRMERSKKLLKQTDMSIKDICADAGYYDVSSYIRRFKQYAGVTPLQYRQGAHTERAPKQHKDA